MDYRRSSVDTFVCQIGNIAKQHGRRDDKTLRQTEQTQYAHTGMTIRSHRYDKWSRRNHVRCTPVSGVIMCYIRDRR